MLFHRNVFFLRSITSRPLTSTSLLTRSSTGGHQGAVKPVQETTLKLNRTTLNLSVGDTATLSATITPDAPLTWENTYDTIASITRSADGKSVRFIAQMGQSCFGRGDFQIAADSNSASG